MGYDHGASGDRTVDHAINVNIEDNNMTPHYLTCLGGNGIRVMYIGSNSTITIIHNSNFRTSPYYNAILLTAGNSAGSTNTVDNLVVEIAHNKFYAEDLALVTQPSGRDSVSSRFTRIGLGIPSISENPYNNNYYGSSTSRFAYTLNSSPSAVNSTNQSQPTTDEAVDSTAANSGYETMATTFDSDIKAYLLAMGEQPSSVNAYYGGSGSEDITTYIGSFSGTYADELEIQDGQLVYVGRKLYFARIALENEVASAVSVFS
jgi:hypothetical protein